MSMFGDYMKEKEGLASFENEYGFFTYKKTENACYIGDFYVKPEYRGTKHTRDLVNEMETKAREMGCVMMVAEVDTGDKSPEQGIFVQLRFGYKFSHIENNSIIYFYKDIT